MGNICYCQEDKNTITDYSYHLPHIKHLNKLNNFPIIYCESYTIDKYVNVHTQCTNCILSNKKVSCKILKLINSGKFILYGRVSNHLYMGINVKNVLYYVTIFINDDMSYVHNKIDNIYYGGSWYPVNNTTYLIMYNDIYKINETISRIYNNLLIPDTYTYSVRKCVNDIVQKN